MAKRARAHLNRAGNSIPGAAKKLKLGENTLRRAIANGEVKYVEFAGLRRIPDSEVERIRDLLELGTPET